MNVNSFKDRENAIIDKALPSNTQRIWPSIFTKYFHQAFLSSISIYTHLQENSKSNQYISRITEIKQNLALWLNRHPHLARLWISSFTRDQKKSKVVVLLCKYRWSMMHNSYELWGLHTFCYLNTEMLKHVYQTFSNPVWTVLSYLIFWHSLIWRNFF